MLNMQIKIILFHKNLDGFHLIDILGSLFIKILLNMIQLKEKWRWRPFNWIIQK